MKTELIKAIWEDTRNGRLKDADFYNTSNSTLSKYSRVFEVIIDTILDGGADSNIARGYLGRILDGERIIAIVIAMSQRFYVRDWPVVHEQLKQDNVDNSKIHAYMNTKFKDLFKEGFSPRVEASVDEEVSVDAEMGDLFDQTPETPSIKALQLRNKILSDQNQDLKKQVSTLQIERDRARDECSQQRRVLIKLAHRAERTQALISTVYTLPSQRGDNEQ